MANTLTAIIPDIYAGLDLVSRELIGMIPAVQRNSTVERAAVGQVVTVPVVPAASGGDVVPGTNPPDDGDVVIGAVPVTITKSKYSPVRWNGEEQLAIGPTGQYNKILADQFAQSMRWLANQIEVDLMTEGAVGASRVYGTAGNAPFGTAADLTDFAGVNRLLDENGAPLTNRKLVIGAAARFNLEGKQSVLFKANEAATDELLRRRVLLLAMGFAIGYTHAAQTNVPGTGTTYAIGAGGEAVGQTTLTLASGTPGATGIKAGDVITIAGDTNKYVVKTGLATAAGDIVIGAPGLRIAAAAGALITVQATAMTANLGFTENAIVLAARAPALPEGGDSADDRMFITDPISGLSFEVSLYRQYRRVRYEVAMAWGQKVVKAEHMVILAG